METITPESSNKQHEDDDVRVLVKVLSIPPRFLTGEDEMACNSILKEFDRKEHEVEDIAQASYAYWYVVTQYNSNDRKAKTIIEPEQARTFSALKEIQRHWIGEGRKRDETIQALRQALEFRKSYGVLALRLLFSQTSNESMTEQEQLHKQWIEEDLQRQPMVVRGCTNTSDDPDSPSRSAMVYKPPRRSPTDARENEAYVMTQIYTAERAMACTQYLQGLMYEKRNHPDDDDTTEEEEEEEEQQQQQRHHFDPHHAESGKLLVLFSFDGYQSNQSVTTTAMKTTSTVLQRLYPERLYRLIMLEPAFWMRALMTLMYPLLSTDTTNKLRLVTGKDTTEELLEEVVGRYDRKSMEHILAGNFSSSVDLRRYLYDVPFHRLYDDVSY